jgi:hypothetical protein
MMEENCEVTQCKVDGMKNKQWFVLLGSSQFYGDLRDPGTKGHAPCVQDIQAK